MSIFGHFQALETPGADLGFQGSILGPTPGESLHFGLQFGVFFGCFWGLCSRCFLEGLWITFLTILGWFWAQVWGRFRYILDINREPAQNHEKPNFCCYLLYFRHVADPDNDAISEHVHVRLVVFFSRHCLGGRISAIWVIFGVPWGLYWSTLTCWGHVSGL